jgi:hypothetical protein
MKVEIVQFSYSAQLPNGQPINLQIGVHRDGNYMSALNALVSLLAQASEDFKKEISMQSTHA